MGDRVILPGIDLGSGDEGQERLERLKKLAARAGFYHGGQPSIGRYIKSLSDIATKPPVDDLDDCQLDRVKDDSEWNLDKLEEAIRIRRHQIMASKLNANGFETRLNVESEDLTYWFNYILVYDPNDGPSVFADLGECRRLLDTVRNLPPAEAFARWKKKVKSLEKEPYTELDAKRDMRAEREELKQLYAEGRIDAEGFRLGFVQARGYLDLAGGQR